jgi:hypothetical protein
MGLGGVSATRTHEQGCGSGSGLDPDSFRSVDPDSESGSRSRRSKMTHKSRKIFNSSCFEVLDDLFLRAEGFVRNLDVLY